MQETLLRAWKGIDSIDPTRDSTRSYLFTVARNVLTDLWRAEQGRPKLVSGAAAMAAVAAVPSTDDVDSAVEGWLVAAALETLTPEHRSVIQALYFEGRSVADTARALTVPAGTVKSRAYSVRALRAAFQESGFCDEHPRRRSGAGRCPGARRAIRRRPGDGDPASAHLCGLPCRTH